MILHMLSTLSMFVVMVNDTYCYLIYFKFMLVQVKQSMVSFNFIGNSFKRVCLM